MTNGENIEVGDPVTFVPHAFYDFPPEKAARWKSLEGRVTGTVVMINREHRFYRVRVYLPNGETLHECFKY